MTKPGRSAADGKQQLHPRNRHRDLYDFEELMQSNSALEKYLSKNSYGNLSIDFKDPGAIKALNKALLFKFYGIELWDIPEGYLCPPIPGRADYIHNLADLLKEQKGQIPTGKTVRILDIGTGANCIYPLIGHKEYGWTFVGSEIDHLALRSAKNIVEANMLNQAISIRKQSSPANVLEGVVHHAERFTAVMCNPPFHSSLQESMAGTDRKWKNLGKIGGNNKLNFGGKNSELWCEGGELQFVSRMIQESKIYSESVLWFSSLISKKESLPAFYNELKKVNAKEIRTIPMSQGQKISRILAWNFK